MVLASFLFVMNSKGPFCGSFRKSGHFYNPDRVWSQLIGIIDALLYIFLKIISYNNIYQKFHINTIDKIFL